MKITEILEGIELHDSVIDSLNVNIDGSMELRIDIDEVWNKTLSKTIKGLVFSSVYEISEFKIDRLNIIGSVEVEEINDYNNEFVTHKPDPAEKTIILSIEFVAGGSMVLVCEDSGSYLV